MYKHFLQTTFNDPLRNNTVYLDLETKLFEKKKECWGKSSNFFPIISRKTLIFIVLTNIDLSPAKLFMP